MTQMFEVKRGTNISHWLSQSDRRGAARRAWFTEADVQRIAGWNAEHIRLPVDEEQLWHADGTRDEEAFDLLNAGLDWCAAAGLKVIVDLHILRSHYFISETEPTLYSDPAELAKFTDLWRDLSACLRARPTDQVAYELLNEAVANEPESWNRVVYHVFDVVRALEPERTIVIGSNQWCQVQTFPYLRVPQDDHLMLTFHYYNPMLITHYTAPWTGIGVYSGPIQYPGAPVPDEGLAELDRTLPEKGRAENSPLDRDTMRQHITIAVDVAQAHTKPLYCGEFGVYSAVPTDIRCAWYRDIIAVFDEFGIGWANWDYKGDFGLITPDGAETGIREALGL
jgi:endoglucanase